MTIENDILHMKIVVEISPELGYKVTELIKQGKFTDFDQFVGTAFSNQVLAETGETGWSLTPPIMRSDIDRTSVGSLGNLPQIPHLLAVPIETIQTRPPMTNTQVVGSTDPLWGQFYRYLPLKVGIRVLTNASTQGPIPVEEFYELAAETAEMFRLRLAEIDRRTGKGVGEKLATSFPNGGRRSRLRYISQFLIGVRPTDHRVSGFMSRLGFASVAENGEGSLVSPTSWGLEFSRIGNPIIDDDSPASPLSQEETKFLLQHTSKNVRPEYDHMVSILKALPGEGMTGEELNGELRGFYLSFQKNSRRWSPGMTNTMRSGATSRMVELGLIRRTRPNRGAPFLMTESGKKWLEGVERQSPGGARA